MLASLRMLVYELLGDTLSKQEGPEIHSTHNHWGFFACFLFLFFKGMGTQETQADTFASPT